MESRAKVLLPYAVTPTPGERGDYWTVPPVVDAACEESPPPAARSQGYIAGSGIEEAI